MLNLLSLTASCLASPRLFFALLPPPLPLPDDGAVCKCWLSIIALCGPTVTKCVWLNWPRRRRRCRVFDSDSRDIHLPGVLFFFYLRSWVFCLGSWHLSLFATQSVDPRRVTSVRKIHISVDDRTDDDDDDDVSDTGETVSKNCLQLFIEIYVNCPKKKLYKYVRLYLYMVGR